ncbi:two-component hybrid sensor and regulator [Oceanicola granulosus HTCC2516]|uniref:histidine kinase n=1 Tax=Oceanicola granulosus (strain ATCC BAA-861 / DSM 15982 / KCTC 12143 / HTCC2516) TaxID=314256 RepID=Q2CF02_OCEGH|nr:HAMP domain-containing sensor histidine kinase [Oceanicola granulosus]EAR51325.1 two-component hybrid sensor and regulator [Oceanicola granulosus HTCC2516]
MLRVASVLSFFAGLVAVTIWIATALVEHAVERDASRRSLEWAEFAVWHVPRIDDLAQGLPSDPAELAAFEDLAHFGGVFRFKIFSPDGVLRFVSDDPGSVGSSLGTHNEHAVAVLTSGEAMTFVKDGREKPDRPDLYSETYLPVYDGDRLVAIAETYMDQTTKVAAVRTEYAIVGAALAGMILLALLIPSGSLWVMFRRLRRTNAELEEAQVRAQASDKSKSEFISTVSHELRTPLTSIKGALAMLESGKFAELDGSAKRLLEMALKNAEVLHLLVDDLLDFGKLATGGLEIRPCATDIAGLVQDEVDRIDSYDADRQVECRYTGERGPLFAHADPARIAQVVRNLLSNALKFSPVGGKVFVSVRERCGAIRVEVKDFGCGIPPCDQERIFEKFTQIDSSNTRQHSGAGLGLAISKEIVEAHDGRIGVTSAPGRGSAFYIDLPFCEGAAEAGAVELRNVA